MVRYKVSTNKLKPAVPCIYLYDKNGAQDFTNAGEFHTWDTTKVITQHFFYTSDSDRIYLEANSSGLFLIEFDCSFFIDEPDAFSAVITSIYKNGVQEEGTLVETSASFLEITPFKVCQSLHSIVYMQKGDYIQIHTITDVGVGELYSMGETSRLIITYLPMQGWDNSAGGRIEYKGGVVR